MHAEWKNTQKKRKDFSRRRRRLESYLTSSYRLFFPCVLEFCFVRLQFSVMSSSIAAPIENYIRGTSAKWNNGAEAKYHDGEDILLLRFGAWDSVPFFLKAVTLVHWKNKEVQTVMTSSVNVGVLWVCVSETGRKMFIAFQHDVLARAHRHSHPHTVRFDLTRSHAAKGDMLTCAPGVWLRGMPWFYGRLEQV